MFWKKYSNIHLKQTGLCQFFHETWWFFEVFEIPGADGSLNLIFFYKNLGPHSSLILNVSKYPELAVL